MVLSSGTGPSPRAVQVVFRSVNKLLMDTATSEYLFCADFFAEDAVFHELLAATLAAVESNLGTSVQASDITCSWRNVMGVLIKALLNYNWVCVAKVDHHHSISLRHQHGSCPHSEACFRQHRHDLSRAP